MKSTRRAFNGRLITVSAAASAVLNWSQPPQAADTNNVGVLH